MGANLIGLILTICYSADNRAAVDFEYREKTYPIGQNIRWPPPGGNSLDPRHCQIFPDLSFRKKFSGLFCAEERLSGVRTREIDRKAALQRAEDYYAEHPRSPSAVRRPKLSVRSGTWIALLGRSMQEGIVGFGPTVERALRAFDTQYLNLLRPPSTLDRAA